MTMEEIAHELKTPITSLQGYIQLLARALRRAATQSSVSSIERSSEAPTVERGNAWVGRGVPEEPCALGTRELASLVHLASSAESQCRRLTHLLDNFLDVSRMQSGKLVLEPEEVDLAALIREAMARLQPEHERQRCAIIVEADSPVLGFWDRLRCEQIVENLVSNAMKYGCGKPVKVRLLEREDRVRLEVVDHGIGITAADQNRLFERFERAVPERDYRGTGLGLWITRRLVEAHGGTIHLRSAPGVGSEFAVELPRSAASRAA